MTARHTSDTAAVTGPPGQRLSSPLSPDRPMPPRTPGPGVREPIGFSYEDHPPTGPQPLFAAEAQPQQAGAGYPTPHPDPLWQAPQTDPVWQVGQTDPVWQVGQTDPVWQAPQAYQVAPIPPGVPVEPSAFVDGAAWTAGLQAGGDGAQEPSLFDDRAWAARRSPGPVVPPGGTGPIRIRAAAAAAAAAAGAPGGAAETARRGGLRTPILLRGTLAVALAGAVAASWVRAASSDGPPPPSAQIRLDRPAAAAGTPALACAVDYAVSPRGGKAYAVTVTVHNTGATPIEGWQLGWPERDGQQITYGWNASVAMRGQRLTAADAGFNHTVPVGGRVSFGYTVGPNRPRVPADGFALNGVMCG